jgi:hypothetical protein
MIKTVPRIEAKDPVEKLTEEKKDDLFTDMIMGKDVTDEVETGRGKFEIKYPRAADIVKIGNLMAFRRNYKPIESFDAETEMVNVMASTLDVVVVSGPPWYEEAKKTNPKFTFLEAPSREFLAELYSKAYSFRGEVEQRLDVGKRPAGKRISAKKGNDDAMDGGAFGSLSSEPANSGA